MYNKLYDAQNLHNTVKEVIRSFPDIIATDPKVDCNIFEKGNYKVGVNMSPAKDVHS